jgi:hypothetical protein
MAFSAQPLWKAPAHMRRAKGAGKLKRFHGHLRSFSCNAWEPLAFQICADPVDGYVDSHHGRFLLPTLNIDRATERGVNALVALNRRGDGCTLLADMLRSAASRVAAAG